MAAHAYRHEHHEGIETHRGKLRSSHGNVQRYNVLVSCRSLRNLLQSGCDLLSLRHTGNVRVQLACCLPNLTDEASIVNKFFPALHSCKRQILFHVCPTYYLGIGEKQSYLQIVFVSVLLKVHKNYQPRTVTSTFTQLLSLIAY